MIVVPRQGAEWHKYRTVCSRKMLKMKEVQEYCGSMNDVADDFIQHINDVRNSESEVADLDKELFKWSMECEFSYLSLEYVKLWNV